MQENIIFKVEFDETEAKKNIKDLFVSLLDLKKEKANIEAQNKAGKLTQAEYANAILLVNEKIKANSDATKQNSKDIEFATKAKNANIGSYDALKLSLAQEEKALKSLAGTLKLNTDGTIALNEEYSAQFQKVRELKDAQLAFDAVIKNGISNVGNYGATFLEASKNQAGFTATQEELTKNFNSANERLADLRDGLQTNSKGQVILTDEYKAQVKVVEELAKKQATLSASIANNEKVTTSFDETLGALKEGNIKGAIKGVIDLGKAFIANPIGIAIAAVVVIFTSFNALLNKSTEGSQALAQAGAAFGQVFSAVFKFLAPGIEAVAKGISFVAEGLSNLLGGANSAELEKGLIQVNKRLAENEAIDAKSLATQEQLKLKRDDTAKGIDASIEANRQLGVEIQKNGDKNLKLENEKLKILEGQLSNLGNTVDAEEKKKEIQEQSTKIEQINADLAGKLTEQRTNENSKLKEKQDLLNSIKDAETKNLILSGKIKEGSQEELNAKIESIKAKNKASLKGNEENLEQTKLLNLQSENEILSLKKDFNEKATANYKDALDKRDEKEKQARDKINADNILSLQNNVNEAQFKYDVDVRNKIESENRKQEQIKKNNSISEEQKNKLTIESLERSQKLEIEALEKINETKTNLAEEQLNQEIAAAKGNRTIIEAKSNEFLFNKQKLANDIELKIAENALQIEAKKDEQLFTLLQKRSEIAEAYAQRGLDATNFAIEQAQRQIEKSGDPALFDALNELLVQQNANELALLITQNEAKEEQNRIALEQNQITKAEFDSLELQRQQTFNEGFINNENARVDGEISAQQRKSDAQFALDTIRLNAAQAISSSIISIFGQETIAGKIAFAAQKAIALAQVAINIQKQISNVFLKWSSIPIGGQALAIAEVATAIAQGASIFASIQSAKFAKGDLLNIGASQSGTFRGRSHANGGTKGVFDDGTKIEVEAGEKFAIINKHDAHLVDALGRINGISGKRFGQGALVDSFHYKYADGGLAGLNSTAQIDINYQITNSLLQAVASLPAPIVQVSEIERIQNLTNSSVVRALE